MAGWAFLCGAARPMRPESQIQAAAQRLGEEVDGPEWGLSTPAV
jgi:hypothetical protein